MKNDMKNKPEIHKWLCIATCEGKLEDAADYPPREAVRKQLEAMGLKITCLSTGWNVIE